MELSFTWRTRATISGIIVCLSKEKSKAHLGYSLQRTCKNIVQACKHYTIDSVACVNAIEVVYVLEWMKVYRDCYSKPWFPDSLWIWLESRLKGYKLLFLSLLEVGNNILMYKENVEIDLLVGRIPFNNNLGKMQVMWKCTSCIQDNIPMETCQVLIQL